MISQTEREECRKIVIEQVIKDQEPIERFSKPWDRSIQDARPRHGLRFVGGKIWTFEWGFFEFWRRQEDVALRIVGEAISRTEIYRRFKTKVQQRQVLTTKFRRFVLDGLASDGRIQCSILDIDPRQRDYVSGEFVLDWNDKIISESSYMDIRYRGLRR
jgi:hypothetical protein